MDKKRLAPLSVVIMLWLLAPANKWLSPLAAQELALKSNLVYDATGTINVGAEAVIGRGITLDVPVSYNPWTFANNRKWKHLLLQPEIRWWQCEEFEGSFWGIHSHYAYYNVGGIGTKHTRLYRYQGWLVGAGISYGYQFYISPRFSIETSLGAGYALMNYDKYDCEVCGAFVAKERTHYLGPTKAAVSLVYIIR